MSLGAPLSGRKKFLADFRDAKETTFEIDGVKVLDLVRGEDDGSILCKIEDTNRGYQTMMNLLVPDTSEYPEQHRFHCFVQEDSPTTPECIQDAMSELEFDASPRPIEDYIQQLLFMISKRTAAGVPICVDSGSSDDEVDRMDVDDDDESDAYFDDADDWELGAVTERSFNTVCLQRDFEEIAAMGYRPGLIRVGSDDFALSISIPAYTLAQQMITPQALTAWDPKILWRTQNFTLVIYGMRSTWPILGNDGFPLPEFFAQGSWSQTLRKLLFRVGLTRSYKPSKDLVWRLVHNPQNKGDPGGSREEQCEEPVSSDQYPKEQDDELEPEDDTPLPDVTADNEPALDEDSTSTFHFGLSTPLELLMQEQFLALVALRIRYGIGWAAAELLLGESNKLQKKPEHIIEDMQEALDHADEEERQLRESYNLPVDPILDRRSDSVNFPLLAFSYLLRRFTLCPRFCLVCYQKLNTEFVALKPYVCDSGLCALHYYYLNRGPSLEYDILTRSDVVDVLLSLTYFGAASKALQTSLPIGLGLSVPLVNSNGVGDTLHDFDKLDDTQESLRLKSEAVTHLLGSLPPVRDMRRYLINEQKEGRLRPKLTNMDPSILPAAWMMLRWCIGSCTAHLESVAPEDRIYSPNKEGQLKWKQFIFSVGSPDAEAKLEKAKKVAAESSINANSYPSIYAFHGSPIQNWHSIIRNGLWFKTVAHGRAYGDGVYFSTNAAVSQGYSARRPGSFWPSNRTPVTECLTVAEIVNLPEKFKSQHPYLVVPEVDWIVCRYLFVGVPEFGEHPSGLAQTSTGTDDIPKVLLDPKFPLMSGGNHLHIPNPSHKFSRLLKAIEEDHVEEIYDEDDQRVFSGEVTRGPPESQELDLTLTFRAESDRDEWEHDPSWVTACLPALLPPPDDAMRMATMALQRELKSILTEQDRSKSLAELGWYLPPEFIGDNLFQWILELHSFDASLPIAQDMKARSVNSIVLEVQFPPEFPHSPPFFRILKPRLLPFIQGGGGHVTGGGSMCMDLLTADGWLPSYSVPAVLLQIKLAISNLEPRPARLAVNWDVPYTMAEAVTGFKRAAQTHGWKIPDSLQRQG